MKDSVTIYHNPRCSKSRATLALIEEQGKQADVIEYLNTPPSEEVLRNILDMLGLEPRELMRTKEAEYKEAGLDDMTLSRDDLIATMVKYPKLIERPIVIKDGKAVIGRPPENILKII